MKQLVVDVFGRGLIYIFIVFRMFNKKNIQMCFHGSGVFWYRKMSGQSMGMCIVTINIRLISADSQISREWRYTNVGRVTYSIIR